VAATASKTRASATPGVPFLDLRPMHADVKEAILRSFESLIDDGGFTNGPAVAEFETAFARYCTTSHAVGLASGLDALRLALLAAGIEAGDEVIVPANTFVATLEAVTQSGGRPVLVDVTEADWNVDGAAAAEAVGARTRFVLPVHLYGQMADMIAIRAIAEKHGLGIVEDACQAHGATRDGLRSGAAGTAAAFSFYPGKNLGAFGDAGALTTDDARLDMDVRALREHGQRRKYHHELEGYTARLDTIQAIVLAHKLPLLDDWNVQRRAAARFYLERLQGVGDLGLPPVPAGSEPVWHLFVVRTNDPEALAETLATRGISTGRHYPEPTHLAPAYSRLGYARGNFPVTEALAGSALSLPLFPGISEAQLETTAAAIEAHFRGER
jgi:dTDP-4-amino-4,6-dideoxygalactose transaminase